MPAPLERDVDATREALLRWFARVVPGGTGFGIEGIGGPADTGFSSDTLMFDLAYERAGEAQRERLVVRIEPRGGFPIFPHYDAALQFHVMRAVGRHGVPVPAMRWLETDASVLGSRFYVMDRVEGRVPSDRPPYHQGGWVFDLPAAQRATLWWNGLEAMCRVHRIDPTAGGFDFLPRPEPGRSPIASRVEQYARFLDWGCRPERLPLLARALDWLRANAPTGEPLGICWGDARLANQIFRDLECVAVIDWEMVHLGNPVADLGWWTTMDRCFSEGIGVPRAEGFPGVAETVARWQDLVGRKAEHFGYYEVFAAFRFAVIMARVAGQLKHYDMLPPDHDMDRNNLASVVLARLLEEAGAR